MTETQDQSSDLQTTETPPPEFDAVESLLRLLVGASIEGPAELAERLQQWEELAAQQQAESALAEDFTPEQLRYALVGFIFESHTQLRGSLSRLGRLASISGKLMLKATRPISSSRPMQPVHKRIDQLAAQGETAVNQWIARGQIEEPQSRLIAREALGETVDEVINHLAENPEIQHLVTQQGVGLAGELVDNVRSRTVTADTVLERLARGFLKRPPREQLPPPSEDVLIQAAKLHIESEGTS
ncbi:MAG: hypothetical protein GY796_30850 [Chloroflexi bacterium]|nr:hypothetical protein [Chloroflexota bacterium]